MHDQADRMLIHRSRFSIDRTFRLRIASFEQLVGFYDLARATFR